MPRENKKIIIITLTAAVLIGGAIFGAVKFKKSAGPAGLDLPLAEDQLFNAGQTKVEEPAAGRTAYKTCAHAGYGFSFVCPADWISDLFKDGGGEVAVIQNAETGILIYIYPFDEPGPITKERIIKDVPNVAMADSRQIKIGGPPAGEAGTIDALSFSSNEREIGPTIEIWFVHKNFLYQISASAGSEEALDKMMETWKFD